MQVCPITVNLISNDGKGQNRELQGRTVDAKGTGHSLTDEKWPNRTKFEVSFTQMTSRNFSSKRTL